MLAIRFQIDENTRKKLRFEVSGQTQSFASSVLDSERKEFSLEPSDNLSSSDHQKEEENRVCLAEIYVPKVLEIDNTLENPW